ncbi:MAG: hypothetical protein FWB78_10020 [Treponema sp.]|nr:hypothetical protein [Treponema sp.]
MGDIFPKLQLLENNPINQEKLVVLVNDFGRLEESQKDYILDLTQKLVGIHCSKEYGDAVAERPYRLSPYNFTEKEF